ncbi:MAG: AsmA family protein, partial [Proteobacteria bacterium]|nr:AsmA family protein [Pseudomonadota bacterium]
MKLSLNFGIKQLVFYGVILIAVFILSSPFIINRVINTSYIKDRISSFIYKKTGANIDSSKYSLTIFPHASLRIDNFNFMAGDRLIASIDVLKFNIDIKPLLRGKININQITIDHPQINASTLKEKPATLPVDFSLSNYIQELKKVFEFLPEHQESVEITIKNATSQYFRRMDGSLSLSKEKQEIVLNTLIKGIKLKPSEISGTAVDTYLDLNSIELDQIKSIVKISSKGEIQGQCNFIAPKLTSKNNHTLLDSDIIDADFKLSDNFYQVDIAPFELNYPKGKVAIHFETHQTQKQSNIQFIGTQIHIDQAKQMSLRLFKDNEITKTLFNILHKGIVPNISVSFQSKDLKNLFNPHHLTLTGNIEDGSVRIPKTDLIADHVNGKANIHNGILEITANKGLIQTSKIEKGDLTIDLLNYEDIPFHGVFLLDVDLSMIPKTLISLLPDTLLSKELSFVHDVIGHSKARLNLLLETGSDDLKVNVSTDDFGVTGIYDRIPGNISLENVNFKYDPDTVILNHLSGGINGSSVQDLNAKIDLKNKTWINIQSGSGMISLDSMIPWLLSYKKTKQIISPVKDGSGKVYFTSIDLSGPITKPEQWTYDVIGTGLGINARTLLNQKQIENMSCQYHISNDLIDLKKIHVKIKSLTFLEQLIEKKHLDSILVPFDVENGNLHISPNHSFFQTNLKFKSGPELYIDLKGKTLSLSSLQTIKFFDPDSSNGTMSFNHNTKKPLFDFNGRLNTVTLKKIVMPGSFWANKMDDVTEGQPISIHTDKDLVLN